MSSHSMRLDSPEEDLYPVFALIRDWRKTAFAPTEGQVFPVTFYENFHGVEAMIWGSARKVGHRQQATRGMGECQTRLTT